MRLYNGKPLVNSVTAKTSSMKAIFPLVKKYGGVVVGLTITEEGIPRDGGRGGSWRRGALFRLPSPTVSPAATSSLTPLTMAVSAGQDAALVTLDALERVKRELGVKDTPLGVFPTCLLGMPRSGKPITSAFFLMALAAWGWDAAIHELPQLRGHDARVPLILRPFRLG